ncbi:unnamed protein product [Macrosiphum euphorbiae]|uniref:Uncharacterized protein n=1 Tax=Macrosiphum euphorbiae TaxID=13131 RepID=A0AAV0Y1V3_9HEMI|nr:unnamed protein product [Macrosiphum euphorbiae]
MPPTEAAVMQLEVRLMNLTILVGIFLVLVVYTGFYAFIYKSSDCVRRSEGDKKATEVNKNGIDPCGCRRWFQPFCNLNADPDDLQSTEWLGDWSSVCSSASSISADDESGVILNRNYLEVPPQETTRLL